MSEFTSEKDSGTASGDYPLLSAIGGPADIKRLEKYLDSWEATVEWVVGQERLDLPHSHPLKHAVAPMPALPPVENAAVDDVVRYMVTARDELLMSASSNQATGLDAADAERHRKVLEKVADFLENYIKQILPLDLPESTRSASASV